MPDSDSMPEDGDALVRELFRELNRLGARYVVVGSHALRHHGADVLPDDVALLIAGDSENQRSVLQALDVLPEKAARELQGVDLLEYVQVQVADRVTVDLAINLCGVTYADAASQIEWVETEGVRIPYASLILLWKAKQNHLEEDEPDRIFLRERLKGILPEEELHSSPVTEGTSEGFLGQIWRKIF